MCEGMADFRDVTAIFVTYNSAQCVARALASLPPEMPVVLIDNGSSDDTVVRARAACTNLCIEVQPQNIGYGRALNRGVRLAQTPFVLMSNPDVIFNGAGLGELVAATDQFPKSFLFSPSVRTPDGSLTSNLRSGLFTPGQPLFKPLVRRKIPAPAHPTRPVEVGWIGGWIILAQRRAFLDFGGFDENIFLFFEETDLCYRATQAGVPPVFVPTTPMTHFGASSCGDVSERALYFRQWHFSWSRFYLAQKYSDRVSWWGSLVYPLQYWIKRQLYTAIGLHKKAVYYAAQFDGACAALQNKPALIRSPADGGADGAEVAK